MKLIVSCGTEGQLILHLCPCQRWAVIKGQPKAGIAAYLIERGVEDAKDKGDLPRQPLEPPPKEDGDQAIARDVAEVWRKLLDGEELTPDEEKAIAEVCDRSTDQVHDVVRRIRGGDE